MIIYKITNTKNGMVYIGQTIKSIKSRFLKHKADAKNLKIKNKLVTAIRDFGEHNFEIEQVCGCASMVELSEKELYYINFYNSVVNGYNTFLSGNNTIPSIASRVKNSQTNTGKSVGELNPMYNKKHSAETIELLKEIRKTRVPNSKIKSEDHKYILKMLEFGRTLKEIGETFNVTGVTIFNLKNKLLKTT